MDKVHVYICFHFALIKSTSGHKTRLFPSLFPFYTSRFLILANAFRNDCVAARSTAFRGATEKNEMVDYVTVPCSSKVTQRSSRADCFKFLWRQQIGCDGTHPEHIFTFKVGLKNNSCNRYCKLADTVNLASKYCTSQFKKLHICTGQLN